MNEGIDAILCHINGMLSQETGLTQLKRIQTWDKTLINGQNHGCV